MDGTERDSVGLQPLPKAVEVGVRNSLLILLVVFDHMDRSIDVIATKFFLHFRPTRGERCPRPRDEVEKDNEEVPIRTLRRPCGGSPPCGMQVVADECNTEGSEAGVFSREFDGKLHVGLAAGKKIDEMNRACQGVARTFVLDVRERSLRVE
jgi:hypothetical protein